MKRAAALVPLSREHHEALVLARRACEPWRVESEPAALCAKVLRRWDALIAAHLAREETHLLPALHEAGEHAAAAEALRQHGVLREAIDLLRDGDLAALPAWGDAMREHVKWEERELFPLAERVLDLARLEAHLDTQGPLTESHP